MESLRGQLLVAAPVLLDPNFLRSVILIAEHNEEGALGVVLNRPSEATVGDVVPDLASVIGLDDPVFAGGPVQPGGVLVLAEFDDPTAAALPIDGNLGFVALDSDLGSLGSGTRRARAFAGHAGWGPGQLDGELERGDWILEPARLEDAFSGDPRGLWSEVLTRKGGSYALVARMPADPSMN